MLEALTAQRSQEAQKHTAASAELEGECPVEWPCAVGWLCLPGAGSEGLEACNTTELPSALLQLFRESK